MVRDMAHQTAQTSRWVEDPRQRRCEAHLKKADLHAPGSMSLCFALLPEEE